MPIWEWVADALALVALLFAVVVTALVLRRRSLSRPGGTFDLSVNSLEGPPVGDEPPAGRGWVLGVGRYGENDLEWFRTFSLSLRPRYRFERGHVHIGSRRDPVGREIYTVHRGHVIVTCDSDVGVRQLALSPNALTGLQAWLEASPPGQRINNVL